MEYFIGVVLAAAVGVFTTLLGMDRDRALYPVILIVIASYYDLFAVMDGSNQTLVIESAAARCRDSPKSRFFSPQIGSIAKRKYR